jgi:hypothetical protein
MVEVQHHPYTCERDTVQVASHRLSVVILASVWSKLSVYLRFMMLLSVGNLVLVMLCLTLTRSLPPPAVPFSINPALAPGRLAPDLGAAGYRCDSPTNNFYVEVCVVEPTTGSFSQISVVVQQRRITTVKFTVREPTLSLGDLVVLWGHPNQSSPPADPALSTLTWRHGNDIWHMRDDAAQINYRQPIQSISLSAVGSQ